ncbi:arginine/serine-rich protein PNISR-like [Oscarella lobularis]|uniref:arginine/serine-rich protein PNISR-like n=1 Tax=Oscarella lobularis TaxID=121494 RepID=UPI00331449C9
MDPLENQQMHFANQDDASSVWRFRAAEWARQKEIAEAQARFQAAQNFNVIPGPPMWPHRPPYPLLHPPPPPGPPRPSFPFDPNAGPPPSFALSPPPTGFEISSHPRPPLPPQLPSIHPAAFPVEHAPPIGGESYFPGVSDLPTQGTSVNVGGISSSGEGGSKRLPQWIRQGLEKLERDKRKKSEQEMVEAEMALMRDHLQATLEYQQQNSAAKASSKISGYDQQIDSSDEDENEEDKIKEDMTVRNEEEKETEDDVDIAYKMRLVLTDLLLAVTDKEIQVIAREVVTSMQDESVQEEGRKPTTPKTTKAITGLQLYATSSSSEEEEKEEKEEREPDRKEASPSGNVISRDRSPSSSRHRQRHRRHSKSPSQRKNRRRRSSSSRSKSPSRYHHHHRHRHGHSRRPGSRQRSRSPQRRR